MRQLALFLHFGTWPCHCSYHSWILYDAQIQCTFKLCRRTLQWLTQLEQKEKKLSTSYSLHSRYHSWIYWLCIVDGLDWDITIGLGRLNENDDGIESMQHLSVFAYLWQTHQNKYKVNFISWFLWYMLEHLQWY